VTDAHKSFFYFFLLSSFVMALLVILEFSPPYEASGALNRLYELVSRSYWVRMSSLPSHFIVFRFLCLDELMW
jgi:hypothetical protein